MNLLHVLDLSNAFFESGGAIAAWLNVRSIYRDKKVSGINWLTPSFFGAWGLFNLMFYPLLGLWLSAVAGGFVFIANMTWTVLAVRYKSADKTKVQGQVPVNAEDLGGYNYIRDRYVRHIGTKRGWKINSAGVDPICAVRISSPTS